MTSGIDGLLIDSLEDDPQQSPIVLAPSAAPPTKAQMGVKGRPRMMREWRMVT
jgi:hypothetical protein